MSQPPIVEAWNSRIGLIEHYEYPPGPAGAGTLHAHRDMQICLSLDFPGRYKCRGRTHDVPAGAVSVLDGWEVHAPSDPFDRDRPSHYIVMYVDPVHFRTSVDLAAGTRLNGAVRTDTEIVGRFVALHRALTSSDSPLEHDEHYCRLASAVLRPAPGRHLQPASASLLRARDYIAAHVSHHIGLGEIAGVAGLTSWHFARAFRERFGVPPHRFQLWLRIDLARRLLADGASGSEVAHRTGFADQSHFIRVFKRLTGMTPSRYRSAASRTRSWLTK
jgi:AraC-like DNA-binding protein